MQCARLRLCARLQASAMQCLQAAVGALAAALPVGGLASAPALHQALRTLLAAVLDVPLGGVAPLAVETAAAEEFARALSPANHDPGREQYIRKRPLCWARLCSGNLTSPSSHECRAHMWACVT